MYTMQEMYDVVARHLLTQGKQAGGRIDNVFGTLSGYGSLYRAPDGTRCAIGCLIPAYAYTPKIEGMTVSQLLARVPSMRRYIPYEDLARGLQDTHDRYQPESWPRKLRQVARAHNLNDAVVDELAPGKGLGLEEPMELFIAFDNITFTFSKTAPQDDFNTYASAFSYTTGKKFKSLDFVLETEEQTAERETKEAIAKAAVRQPSELVLSL